MNDSKIAVRYAKAVFLLAQEKNQLKGVANDMHALLLIDKHVPEMEVLFTSPILTAEQKRITMYKMFESQFNPITMQFISLILMNKRELHITGVARNFIKRYRESLGIKKAGLTTAIEMNADQRAQFVSILKSTYNTEVELETQVDPNLIGGFVLRVEDFQYDASISTRLKAVKAQLLG